MIRRNLDVEIHRHRCDRRVLLPMVEKLSDAEIEALYRLLQSVKSEAEMAEKNRTKNRFGYGWPGR